MITWIGSTLDHIMEQYILNNKHTRCLQMYYFFLNWRLDNWYRTVQKVVGVGMVRTNIQNESKTKLQQTLNNFVRSQRKCW